MPSQTKSAGAGATNNGNAGTQAWSNTSNITASDDARASSSFSGGLEGGDALSEWLQANTFGFAISTNAVITGYVVAVERQGDGGVTDSDVRLIAAGVVGGTNKSGGAAWPSSDATASFGSSTDTWERSLTPADINATNFGVVLAAAFHTDGPGTINARVDHIQITVHYTEAGPRVDFMPGVLSITTTETADAPMAFLPGADLAPKRRSVVFIPGHFFDNLTYPPWWF